MPLKTGFCMLFAVAGLVVCLTPAQAATVKDGFVSVSGTRFVLNGAEFVPLGLNDQDEKSLWDNRITQPKSSDFSRHFRDFSAYGFNSIRLSVKADYFDAPEGFVWLDQRVRDAKKYKLKILLDMHIPTGGAQQDYQPSEANRAFWTLPEIQGRFLATWKKIAARYATSTAIWAYDLMNEPASRDVNQVSILLQHVRDAIREVDKNHILILQPIQQYDGAYRESYVYPPVRDDKLAYSVHFYRPYGFTVQHVPWGISDQRVIERYPATSTYDGDWDAARVGQELEDSGLRAARVAQVPAVIGEFGAVFHAELRGQYFWINDVLQAARHSGIGWYYWIYQTSNLDGSFGLTDGRGTKRKEILKLLSAQAAESGLAPKITSVVER